MKVLYKDVLRYVILILVSWFAVDITYIIVDFAFLHYKDMSVETAGLLGATETAVLGTWTFVVKKFFETRAGEDYVTDIK